MPDRSADHAERDTTDSPRITTMRALRAHRRGGPETLVFEDAPRPRPGPGEALVEVWAAAITATELTWDLSWTTRDGADRTPVIPSHEMSGIVSELGDGANGPAVGPRSTASSTSTATALPRSSSHSRQQTWHLIRVRSDTSTPPPSPSPR